jgi:UDP-4-amino-4-deoxy-L-arabinose formyltransferase/UDP-glucuronic acid dehydrogenase (UDP-4-keto-hexauronic acid decarboxylating)
MRVVCLAYQLIGHEGLSFLLDESGDQVVAVFTHEDAPGEEVWWPSVAGLARERGVPVFTPEDINAPEWVERIAAMEPDLIVSFWYRYLVKRPVLEIPRLGALNLHGSLLPKYRGRAPVNWVLVNGEQETGVTLHYMTERADAGDIVAQAVVPIGDDDTALDLYRALAAAEREVLRQAWPLLRAGTAPRLAQDHSQATYVGRRTPEDGRFEWGWPAQRVHNLVRAVTHPYPGAFCEAGGRRLYVWSARPAMGVVWREPPAPGTVVAIGEDGIEVATGHGSLLVRRVQREGGEEMDGAEYARREGLRAGMVLV